MNTDNMDALFAQLAALPQGTLDYYLLLFLRVSGVLFTSQLFGRKNVPQIVKISYCLSLTAVFAMASPPIPIVYGTVVELVLKAALELIFGVILGYVTAAFFQLVFTSGNMMDMQIGFGMVNVFDPGSNLQVPVTGNLLSIAMLMCFFVTDGHQKLFSLLLRSLSRVPVGQVTLNPQLAAVAAELFSASFLLAVQVAMPVIAAALLAEVAMGIMIRTVPQLNMFVVGIPVKLLMGLILLYVMLPGYIQLTNHVFDQMFSFLQQMFERLVPV